MQSLLDDLEEHGWTTEQAQDEAAKWASVVWGGEVPETAESDGMSMATGETAFSAAPSHRDDPLETSSFPSGSDNGPSATPLTHTATSTAAFRPFSVAAFSTPLPSPALTSNPGTLSPLTNLASHHSDSTIRSATAAVTITSGSSPSTDLSSSDSPARQTYTLSHSAPASTSDARSARSNEATAPSTNSSSGATMRVQQLSTTASRTESSTLSREHTSWSSSAASSAHSPSHTSSALSSTSAPPLSAGTSALSPALAAADSPSSPSSSSAMSSSKIGAIVGGTLGAVTLLALVALLFFLRRRRSKRKQYASVGADEHGAIGGRAPTMRERGIERSAATLAGHGSAGLQHEQQERGQPTNHFSDEAAAAASATHSDDEREELSEGRLSTRSGYGAVPDDEDNFSLLRAARGYRPPPPRASLDARATPVAVEHNAPLPTMGVVPSSTIGSSSSPSSPSNDIAADGRDTSDLFDGSANPFARDGDESSEGEGDGGTMGEARGRRWLGENPFFGARLPQQ
ncbi:hypothetical protein JCM10213v2_000795 [Rhodosporidiobolus nylandii]